MFFGALRCLRDRWWLGERPEQERFLLLSLLPASDSTKVAVFFFFKQGEQVSFFLTSLLEYNCFIMLCQFLLYNKVNQLYVYIYPHIPSLLYLPPTHTISPIQVVAKHRPDLPVLRCCFPLAMYLTYGSVYMSMLLSLHPSFPLPHHVLKSILLCLHLYSYPATRFIGTFFFFNSIYMCQHTVFFSF